eukprot:1159209-Ditylum_brightwellii.AAC.1
MDKTVYQQQQHLLIQQGHQDLDPGAIWDKDMINFINKTPQSGEIILAMGANGAIDDSNLSEEYWRQSKGVALQPFTN